MIKTTNMIVNAPETRICLLFTSGLFSSLLPVTKPMDMMPIHTSRKVSPNRMGSIVSVDEGQGLSPKTKSQRIPVAAPKTRKEMITETKKPGIPNNNEYKYLFFIEPLETVNVD
jgi:hypothetical protein